MRKTSFLAIAAVIAGLAISGCGMAVKETTDQPVSIDSIALTATYKLTTGINLSWHDMPRCSGYTLSRAVADTGPYTVIAASLNATEYTDVPVAGTKYYYKITAQLDYGNLDYDQVVMGYRARVVTIHDDVLDGVIRGLIGKATGDINDGELMDVTVIDYTGFNKVDKITDLSGLEYCINLMSLRLDLQNIDNVTALQNLSSLETVNLSSNDIKDITLLSGVTATIKHLDIRFNGMNLKTGGANRTVLDAFFNNNCEVEYEAGNVLQ